MIGSHQARGSLYKFQVNKSPPKRHTKFKSTQKRAFFASFRIRKFAQALEAQENEGKNNHVCSKEGRA